MKRPSMGEKEIAINSLRETRSSSIRKREGKKNQSYKTNYNSQESNRKMLINQSIDRFTEKEKETIRSRDYSSSTSLFYAFSSSAISHFILF